MKDYSDDHILKGIASHDSRVISFIYEKHYPMIERMVVNHGGEASQAQDIFQEAMIIIFRKLNSDGIKLCCKFSTYLYSICWRLYIQEIKQKEYRKKKIPRVDMVKEPENESIELKVFDIINKHMEKLSSNCQKILRLHFNKASIEEICNIMGYKNRTHAMDRKYRCKKSLINRIINDPEFKELKDEIIRENRIIY